MMRGVETAIKGGDKGAYGWEDDRAVDVSYNMGQDERRGSFPKILRMAANVVIYKGIGLSDFWLNSIRINIGGPGVCCLCCAFGKGGGWPRLKFLRKGPIVVAPFPRTVTNSKPTISQPRVFVAPENENSQRSVSLINFSPYYKNSLVCILTIPLLIVINRLEVQLNQNLIASVLYFFFFFTTMFIVSNGRP